MSKAISNVDLNADKPKFPIAEPHNLSPRAKWLRDYYFRGAKREWNNEYTPLKTGSPWGERIWFEGDYYIVPEIYAFMGIKTKGPYNSSVEMMAKTVRLPDDFWSKSLPVRRSIFFQESILNYIPQEIISENDLLAGGRFNTQLSKCLNKKEYNEYEKRNLKDRMAILKYHKDGFGNVGATGGHLIPDYKFVVEHGLKALYEKIKKEYDQLSPTEKMGHKGQELEAMMISAETPHKLAIKYAEECRRLKSETSSKDRHKELEQMVINLEHVPWEPATTYWQGLMSLWLIHMLVMSEESYPGPGVSFGRIDQYLWPLYEQDVIKKKSITRDFAKDIFSSFIFHANTAYDAQIKIGKQGITSGFGQLITLSGIGPNGEDLTNEFTYMILECFDEWAPILEPKPNIRLHRNSPDRLLDVIVDMITRAQGAPFILNFDERSIAGMILEGIPKKDAWDYACVGCLENTMQGNDRSGTVNCNANLSKSIELTLWGGRNAPIKQRYSKKSIVDIVFSKAGQQIGPKTMDPELCQTFDQFFTAWVEQAKFLIKYTVDVYNITEQFRADFLPTPYLSILVDGCIEKGVDIRRGTPKIGFMTIEGVGFATTVDSLLAIKKYIFEEKKYTFAQIKEAIIHDFQGKKEYEIMRALLSNKAPKYGNNEDAADELAKKVMDIWTKECWQYITPTGYKFRPGMLSWNYWAGDDAALTIATPNGRCAGTFLSNAICPTNGADLKGPTAVANSVGVVLGGKSETGEYLNSLPNGASHTITFNPSLLRDAEHKDKFKAYLRGYIENGGTALQINILDSEMLKDAQKHPHNYQNLLVRVTGYNAFFTAIGKELQDEIIARESHQF